MLIERGRVTVDGQRARLGDKVDPSQSVVEIDGVRLPLDPELVTWLVYKPAGVVTTMSDPEGRPTVRDLVPDQPATKPVGRLDLHSEGLLLMSNDGDLALHVTHPRYGVTKTYQVLVPATLNPAKLKPLVDGVDLDDGPARASSARIVSSSKERTIVELVLAEGRKREVRRMFETQGHPHRTTCPHRHRPDHRSPTLRLAATARSSSRRYGRSTKQVAPMPDLVMSGPGGAFEATVGVPGDKSLSHRALLFAGMAQGDSLVEGLGTGAGHRFHCTCPDAARRLDRARAGEVSGHRRMDGSGRPDRLRQLGYHHSPTGRDPLDLRDRSRTCRR